MMTNRLPKGAPNGTASSCWEAGGATDPVPLEEQNVYRHGPAEDGHAGPLTVESAG
jgi:hypothetical protein